jgi:hypothetical protein
MWWWLTLVATWLAVDALLLWGWHYFLRRGREPRPDLWRWDD